MHLYLPGKQTKIPESGTISFPVSLYLSLSLPVSKAKAKGIHYRILHWIPTNAAFFFLSLQSVPSYFVSFMADIITARYVIFAFGFLLAVVASFFYSHMLRYEIIGQVSPSRCLHTEQWLCMWCNLTLDTSGYLSIRTTCPRILW